MHGRGPVLVGTSAGNENHGQIHVPFPHFVQKLDAAHAGHADVRDDQVHAFMFEQLQGVVGGTRFQDLIFLFLEDHSEQGKNICLVINDENAFLSRHISKSTPQSIFCQSPGIPEGTRMTPDQVLTVPQALPEARLDQYLVGALSQFSRSQIQKWINGGHILVAGKTSSPALTLLGGEEISVTIPEEETSVVPEKIPLNILFEDRWILVVNKPSGMVTHPAAKNFTGTLLNAVAYHIKNPAPMRGKGKEALKKGDRLRLRPGIVHRLDKDTSGVLVIAKDTKTLGFLSKQFEERTAAKVYRAVVWGVLEHKSGEIVGAISKDFESMRMKVSPSGRYARTDFKILKLFPHHSYIEAYPKTGRTHQIRVHLAKIGHPVLGDTIYADTLKKTTRREGTSRMMLHAYKLSITHPESKKIVTFTAPLPKDFEKVLKSL